MNKLLIVLAALAVVLAIATPALAASLGMSPSKVEVEVPADGSSIVAMTAYYYSGDIEITLEGIPLTVTPGTIHVDAAENPQEFSLTIHGDPSLGSKIYDGYIRFLGKTGEMISVAVKVKARVTNRVVGQEPVPAVPATNLNTAETIQPESSQTVSPQDQAAQNASPGGVTVAPSDTAAGSDMLAGLSSNMVIIIAAGIVFLGLVALAISLAIRRPKY